MAAIYSNSPMSDAEQVTRDAPLTDIEAEVLKLYKAARETDDPSYVRCTAEHQSVNYKDEITASCLFSFRIHKDSSKERRTQILNFFFESLTRRVDEAFSDSPPSDELNSSP
jgi:hypothetical protein